jgi:hypothetical protein
MPGNNPITLTNANTSFSEISWSYDSTVITSTIEELDLIVITNNSNGTITKIPLDPTLTYLNLDKIIDLTISNVVFIDAVVSNTTYSSNKLTVRSRLSTPNIISGAATDNPIITQNQKVTFTINSIDTDAQFFNFILYDSITSKLNEFINIPIPSAGLSTSTTTVTLGSNIIPVSITCEKNASNDKRTVTINNLLNDSTYQIAVYASYNYMNDATTSIQVENESKISNTIQYIEPNSSPQIPTLKSLTFDINSPYNYAVEFITPANSSSYATTYVTLRISSNSNFTSNVLDVPLNFNSINGSTSLPSNTTYILNVDLSGKITPGTTYHYKLIVGNTDSDSDAGNTTTKTNVLSLKACSTPTIVNNADFNVDLYDNNFFDVFFNTSRTIVEYAGTGTISYNIISNSNTYSSVTIPYSINATPGTTYTVTVNATVSNIINKATVANMPVLLSGSGANVVFSASTQSTSAINYSNLTLGTLAPFIYFSTFISPVTSIKASNLGANSLPLSNSINLEWTPGSNIGVSNITYSLIYSKDALFNNPTIVSPLSVPSYTLTTTSNDEKHYFKVITRYANAPTSYIYSKSSNSAIIISRTIESSELILKDVDNNLIGVSSFNLISTPTNLKLDSTKNTIKSSWNAVSNPLALTGKPSLNAKVATVNYNIIGTGPSYNNTRLLDSTNYDFENLVDGNTHTITLTAILNNIYSNFTSGMNFSTASTISLTSGVISGTATPLDGPDITNATYNTNTNILSLTIALNGTPKGDITVTLLGVTDTAQTFSYNALLNHPTFVQNNNEYTISLASQLSGGKLTQYVAITTAQTGISIATFGFNDNYVLNADTKKTISNTF